MAQEWAHRVHEAPGLLAAHQMYMGRAIREAVRAASLVAGELYVLSAGLGLVHANDTIPAYEATISGTSDNNPIRRRGNGIETSQEWWGYLTRSLGAPSPLRRLVESSANETIVVMAISRPYLLMVAKELSGLSDQDLQRVRILMHGAPKGLPEALMPVVISYGAQFDGPDSPLPGTKADFVQRAAVHFVENVINSQNAGTCDDHQLGVNDSLMSMAFPSMPARRRMADDDLIRLIRECLPAVDHQSSRMLRHLRDNLMVSCEQGRFQDLFKAAVSETAKEDRSND